MFILLNSFPPLKEPPIWPDIFGTFEISAKIK